jgi:hypothetical protein
MSTQHIFQGTPNSGPRTPKPDAPTKLAVVDHEASIDAALMDAALNVSGLEPDDTPRQRAT